MTVAALLSAAIAAAGIAPVSRETGERLTRFVATLEAWQARQSLVSRSTGASEIWTRHVADSAQLLALAPAAKRWLDLGSGGGFPGLVLAALLADVPGAAVHLVESNQRKVAFLRAASREAGLGAIVHGGRIEDVVAGWATPIDAISARALAPFETLCAWVEPLVRGGVRAYFHKGEGFAREKEDATLRWTLDLLEHPSRIGAGVIVEVRAIERRNPVRVPQ
ncbi:MAG: 16S rRNA (guanine(527)-N(7))-methyltransferase RsmG [Bauldia sp.]|nr:16S rRNA (guanine(527)-N(7))-methyltransferase RsmG [Bauldia sp.]